MKIRKIHIDEYKIFKNFDINFTFNDKPLNLIVIAGINGSGKTTLLDYIKSYGFYINKPLIFSSNHNIGMDNTLNGITYDYFNDDKRSKDSINSFFLDKNENIEFASKKIVQYIDKMIYEEKKSPEIAYYLTNGIINSIFEGFKLDLQFLGLNRNKEIIFENTSGNELKISDLSSGEQEIICKAFSLYLSDIRDSIILIDEPENSLHPNWQNKIAQMKIHI